MNTTHELEPTETEIHKAAYYLWLESGRETGRGLKKPLPRRRQTIPAVTLV
jgi:hypothetical protein